MFYGQWMMFASVCMALAHDEPYCSVRYERLCQGKGPHIACQYPYRGAGPACENYTSIIFSNDLKRFILHYINRRRQKIASGHERVRGGMHLPKPEIMMFVQWDRELSYLAQRLADQCQFVHDDCRATVRYPYAGQTVGEVRWHKSGNSLERGARRAIGRVFDAWWGERRRVHAKQLISPFALTARGAVWGHFSQLAVWTLRAMGCGAVHHGVTRPRLLLVCDFSHTNMLGQRTISPGPMASCPTHTMRGGRPYPLLCAPPVHSKKFVEDNGGDEKIDEEDDDDDDDDEAFGEEEVLTTRSSIKEESEDAYHTRPWPNRPIRPIQHETIDTDEPIRQQHTTLDVDTQPVRQEHKTMEKVSQPIPEQHRTVDTDDQPVGQQHRTEDIHSQPVREQYVTDQPVKQQGGPVDIERQPVGEQQDTDNQPIRQQHRTVDTDNQLNRHQYKTVHTDRRIRPIQDARPIHDVDDDDTDYRYNRPGHHEILDTNQPNPRELESVDTGSPGRVKEDFIDIDNRAIRPLNDEIVDAEARPVIPLNGAGTVRRPGRPLLNGEEDDIWMKRTATESIRMSARYRDNSDSLFRQKLKNELNSRNRELGLPSTRNREPENGNSQSEMRKTGPKTIYSQPDNKARHKTDNYRSSEIRRKGEYKAHNGYGQKDLEWNRRPFQFERWGDEETKLQDMSAVLPLRRQTHAPVQQVTSVVVYRPTSLFSIQTEPAFRQRWMQTRARPRRPGANALLQSFQTSNPTRFVLIKQSKRSSMVLDKDEEEQLYHDTGFKLPIANR